MCCKNNLLQHKKSMIQRLQRGILFHNLSFCHRYVEGSSYLSWVYLAKMIRQSGNSVLEFMETKAEIYAIPMFFNEGNSAHFEVYVGWISKTCCWRWNLIRSTDAIIFMTWGSFIFLFFITQNRSAPIKQRFRMQPGAFGRSNCNLSGSLYCLS